MCFVCFVCPSLQLERAKASAVADEQYAAAAAIKARIDELTAAGPAPSSGPAAAAAAAMMAARTTSWLGATGAQLPTYAGDGFSSDRDGASPASSSTSAATPRALPLGPGPPQSCEWEQARPGWEQAWSKKYGRKYWHHAATKRTVWSFAELQQAKPPPPSQAAASHGAPGSSRGGGGDERRRGPQSATPTDPRGHRDPRTSAAMGQKGGAPALASEAGEPFGSGHGAACDSQSARTKLIDLT